MNTPDVRAREVACRVTATGPVGAEVGVWRGEMSAHLLSLMPTLTLLMVDAWASATASYAATADPRARDDADAHLRAMSDARDAVAFAGCRARLVRDHSHRAGSLRVDPQSLDFAFIDADHSYEAVKRDIAVWRTNIKPGGLLCGHDYGMWEDRGFGVRQAVDEACERHGWTLELGEDSTWFVTV